MVARPWPVPFANEYQAENWDLEDGFPETSCSSIVAGPDGYFWLGTFRGLLRFNGQNFRAWAPDAMPKLRSTGIMSMYKDRRSRVWMSTLDGLIMYDGEAWRHWGPADGWRDTIDHVRSFAENAAGQLVLTRYSGRVLRFDGTKFEELPEPPGTGGTLAGLDAEGGLYYFRANNAGWFEHGAWRTLPGEPNLGAAAVGVGQSRNGDAFIVCRRELLRVRGGRVVRRIPLSAPVGIFWQTAEEEDGTLWFSAVEAGVYRIRPNGDVRHFGKADGLPYGGGTRSVYVDKAGKVWIGSGVGGLTRFKPARFRFIGDAEGLPDREVLTLTQLRDGRMVFAPYGSGLRAFDQGTVRPFRRDLAIPLYCRSILRTHDDVLWIGANGAGLTRVDELSSARAATEFFTPAGKESVHSLFEDSAGHLWVGGEQSVLRQDTDLRFVRVPLPMETGRRPTIFAERRDGTIVIGQHNDVYALARGAQAVTTLGRLPADARISSMVVDSRDRLWVGTSGHGLHVLLGRELLAVPPSVALPSPRIGALVQDDAGRLWFGSGRTVVRADPDELATAAQQRAGAPRILTFNHDDGLPYLDFTYGTQPNVQKDREGRLWFAMIRGVAMVDPRTITVNEEAPRVVIERLAYAVSNARDRTAVAISPPAALPRIPAGSHLIRLDFAALDFASPRKQRFRVALDGEWQDLRADTSATFLELPPGRHSFHVQAAGGDGTWNREGARLDFFVEPFVWQTLWFRVALGAVLAGLVGAGVWAVSDRRTRTAREILARERGLARAQARLAHVLENTTEFVAFFDEAGAPVYFNRAAHALLDGAASHPAPSAGLAVPSAWTDVVQRDHAFATALRDGSWAGELLVPKNGEVIPVSAVLVAHKGATGAVEFVSMIARDISAAKRHAHVQEVLRELAMALSAALNPAMLGRAVARASQSLFRHDAFFLAAIGGESPAAIQICHAEDETGAHFGPDGAGLPERARTELREVMAGQAVLHDESGLGSNPAPCALGATPMFSGLYAPVRHADRTIGIIAVQRAAPGRYGQADLAQLEVVATQCAAAMARLNAEELLRRNEELLRQSQKLEAVGTLAGGIAHDFNNILAAILGYVEVARGEAKPGQLVHDCIERIEQSSLRARDLVRRILAFSRPQKTVRDAIDIAPIVEEVGKLLRSTTPAFVDIRVQLNRPLPPVNIDPTELHQVLLNLGTNAVHSLEGRGGRVTLRGQVVEVTADPAPAPGLRAGQFVCVQVEDNGTGISAEVLPRIFDPFFTTKPTGRGGGLGLSIAHGIVRACGGAITVSTQPGTGSIFAAFLPVAERKAERGAARIDLASDSAGSVRGHLMVVDDESMITTTLALVFRRAGYEVTTFDNPLDALAAFRREPGRFDLVLTDLSMPGMNGVSLAAEIRARRADVPVILMSGYVQAMNSAAVAEAGISEVVEKPLPLPTLLQLISRLISAGTDRL